MRRFIRKLLGEPSIVLYLGYDEPVERIWNVVPLNKIINVKLICVLSDGLYYSLTHTYDRGSSLLIKGKLAYRDVDTGAVSLYRSPSFFRRDSTRKIKRCALSKSAWILCCHR